MKKLQYRLDKIKTIVETFKLNIWGGKEVQVPFACSSWNELNSELNLKIHRKLHDIRRII